jgi:hypothetical protein
MPSVINPQQSRSKTHLMLQKGGGGGGGLRNANGTGMLMMT